MTGSAFRRLLIAGAFSAGCLAASAASAATVVVNQSLDVTKMTLLDGFPAFFIPAELLSSTEDFSPAFSATIGAGDALDITFTFLAGQTIRANKLGAVALDLLTFDSPNEDVTTSGHLTLFDVSHNPVFTFSNRTTTGGTAQVGGSFSPGGTDVTFHSLEFVGSVTNSVLSGTSTAGPARVYTGAFLDLTTNDTGSFTIGTSAGGPAPVPEPATWAVLILGFFGLGATLRLRRQQLARVTA